MSVFCLKLSGGSHPSWGKPTVLTMTFSVTEPSRARSSDTSPANFPLALHASCRALVAVLWTRPARSDPTVFFHLPSPLPSHSQVVCSFTLSGFLFKRGPRKAFPDHSKTATLILALRCAAFSSSHTLITAWHRHLLESRTLLCSSLYHKCKKMLGTFKKKLNSQCAHRPHSLNCPRSSPCQSHAYPSKHSSNEAIPDNPCPSSTTNLQCTSSI